MTASSFWTEEPAPEAIPLPDRILDVRFGLSCKQLPVDHAYALWQALRVPLPWLEHEPEAGIHGIHVAGSQNGWERPAHGTDSLLQVSRRTKLTIRAPKARVADLLRDLPGTPLDLDGYPLTIGEGQTRLLSKETTLFARHVAAPDASGLDEGAFLAAMAHALGEMGIRMRKALCGKSIDLATPEGPLATRGLLLAGLGVEESIRLQEVGLGPHRLMGCGLFIPHKGIDPVKPD